MHSITVESRRRKLGNIERANPGAEIIDVTSRAPEPWVRFSPFFPHGNIPVPNSDGATAQSVEGVWQALKVFDQEGVDPAKLTVANMKGIKRSVRTRGKVLGHQFGLSGQTLLDYLDARLKIYLPTFRWVLENCLENELRQLRTMLNAHPVVLLDYETNSSVNDLSRPLSHASLVAAYLKQEWPTCNG